MDITTIILLSGIGLLGIILFVVLWKFQRSEKRLKKAQRQAAQKLLGSVETEANFYMRDKSK